MQKFCGIFSQLLQLFPRMGFEQAICNHKAEYQARGFTGWGQFVAMLSFKNILPVAQANGTKVPNVLARRMMQ